MGLAQELLVASNAESHLDDFLCAVCHTLVDVDASVTSCTHVFCGGCLAKWLERKPACPKCATPLSAEDVAELRHANPLAWRILGRVRVRCPLHAVACAWTGDYSELSAHLMSSETHRVGGVSTNTTNLNQADGLIKARAEAEALREAGNEKLRARHYNEAIKLYSKAISLAPAAAYYCNRAAAWLAVGAPREAAADCKAAVALEPGYAKAHARLSKALCELGDADAAVACLAGAVGLVAAPSRELAEASTAAAELQALLRAGGESAAAGDWPQACALYEEASRRTSAPSVSLRQAGAELGRGTPDRAISITLQLLRSDAGNAEAYALRGAAFAQQGDFAQAQACLREALRLAPDDAAASGSFRAVKRCGAASEAGRAAAFSRDFDAALTHFTAALDALPLPPAAPLRTALLTERAAAQLRLKHHDACLADCEAALSASDDSRQNQAAYVTRAACLRQLGRPSDALASLRPALEMDPSSEVLRKHAQTCEFEARKAARPDYYLLLGCGRTASPADVKIAYKARALECHPDRLPPDASPQERAQAEERFKAVGEALDVLGDPLKKQLYDEGHDKQSIEERVAAAARAAHQHHGGGRGAGCSGGGCGSCG